MFHLGWFAFGGIQGWGSPEYDPSYNWARGDLHQDMAKKLEAACFDFILIEDASAVADVYGASFEAYLGQAIGAPKFDPAVMANIIAGVTTRIGIIPTLTTTFYPPFLLARLLATMDHMTAGRAGWNLVTSSSDLAAMNYGLAALPEHDDRYDIADEYVDLCRQLWASWDADAVVADHQTGVFADHTKVRKINFEGAHYRSRGPLNVPQPPQGRPVIAQAGNSPRGMRFAARHADIVLTPVGHPAGIKAVRDEIRRLAVEAGRSPDDIKVMAVAYPVIFDSPAEVAAHREWLKQVPEPMVTRWLAIVSSITGIDFSLYPRDEPLPDQVQTNGSRGTLDWLRRDNATPRQIALRMAHLTEREPLVGTADDIADEMSKTMELVGGDGFLISGPITPTQVGKVVDKLVPALQKRGLVRTSYSHPTFRENLLAF
jgi:FMN-dependent oxidoreductase (nitrilotriacetate monooxygenase family)